MTDTAIAPFADIDEEWLSGRLTGKPPSELEIKFACRWTQLYPAIDLEVEGLLIPKRKYRIDFFHRESKVAIELNGYRDHSSKFKIQRDYRKIQILQAMGWAVFPLSFADVDKDEVLADIASTIAARTLKQTIELTPVPAGHGKDETRI